jgi:hypothetical protein
MPPGILHDIDMERDGILSEVASWGALPLSMFSDSGGEPRDGRIAYLKISPLGNGELGFEWTRGNGARETYAEAAGSSSSRSSSSACCRR